MDDKVKVVADNLVFSLQKTGGGSIYWARLLDSCNADEGIDLAVIERPDAKDNQMRQGISLDGATMTASTLPLRVDEVASPKVQGRTIFHSSYYRTAKGKDCINVTTVHDFICMRQFTGLVKWFSIWQIRRAVKNSDYIVCITENTKSDLLRYVPEAKGKHIEIINQGFDNSVFTFEPTPKEDRVVFIGVRDLAYKNFKAAVEAVALVPGLVLSIVGRPLSEQERVYLDATIPGRYESLEYPSSEDICKLFRRSIALLYLSEYEGFGVPPLEAMASGCPVIALDKSSIPEVGGDAAILLPEADPEDVAASIEALRQDPELLESVVAAGLSQATKFSWEKTVQKTKDLYRRIWNGEI